VQWPSEDTLDACKKLHAYIDNDFDCALDFLSLGGLAVLKSFLTKALQVKAEECRDAACDVLAIAENKVPKGWKSLSSDIMPPPLRFDVSSFLNCPPFDWDALMGMRGEVSHSSTSPNPVSSPSPDLVIRRILIEEKRQTSQQDVGYLLWPASLPFTRWLVAHRRVLFGGGVQVLELGSGCGLCGIAAGIFSHPHFMQETDAKKRSHVVLSDFNPLVLENLRRNAAFNEPSLHADQSEHISLGCLSQGPESLFSVEKLDWKEEGELNSLFDVVIGCDIICTEEDAAAVAKVCRQRLKEGGGLALICVPPNEVRWGVSALPAALSKEELEWSVISLHPSFLQASFSGEVNDSLEVGGVQAEEMWKAQELANETCVAPGYERGLKIFAASRKK